MTLKITNPIAVGAFFLAYAAAFAFITFAGLRLNVIAFCCGAAVVYMLTKVKYNDKPVLP